MLVTVAASVAACSAVGFVWYSDLLFGKVWMRLSHPGKTHEQLGDMTLPVVLSLAGHALAFSTLNCMYRSLMPVRTVSSAVEAGLSLSALVATMSFVHAGFDRKPLALFFIDHGYDTVCLLVSSVIYAYMA